MTKPIETVPGTTVRERRKRFDDCRGIMVNIRHTAISFAESPLVSWNLHYSGPCILKCKDCHSKALWKTVAYDRREIGQLLDEIEALFNVNIIESICIMGTDTEDKEESVHILIDYAYLLGIKSVLYTGYNVGVAIEKYGLPDFLVCGTYQGGEWFDNKTFYRKQERGNNIPYECITMQEYFTRAKESNR